MEQQLTGVLLALTVLACGRYQQGRLNRASGKAAAAATGLIVLGTAIYLAISTATVIA